MNLHQLAPFYRKLSKTKTWIKRSQSGCFVSTSFYLNWTVTKSAPGCIKYAGRCVEWGKGSMLDMSPRPASISWPQALHRSSFPSSVAHRYVSRGLQGTELDHGVPQQYLSLYRDKIRGCQRQKKNLPLYDGLSIATTGQRSKALVSNSD